MSGITAQGVRQEGREGTYICCEIMELILVFVVDLWVLFCRLLLFALWVSRGGVFLW